MVIQIRFVCPIVGSLQVIRTDTFSRQTDIIVGNYSLKFRY